MTLRKLGEKIKTSLHHLSPKNKKSDDFQGGDLSPCSLPPTTTSAATQPSLAPPITSTTQENAVGCCAKANKCQGSKGVNEQKVLKEETAMKTETPAPPAAVTTAEVNCNCSPANPTECKMQNAELACVRASTPRYEESADIFPTMYYVVKNDKKEETVQQSVLLVNPSKSDKTYALRLQGNGAPQLDKQTVSIAGDYVERVTVTVKPKEDTTNVYVDLLEGGHLYDKIRVQVRQPN